MFNTFCFRCLVFVHYTLLYGVPTFKGVGFRVTHFCAPSSVIFGKLSPQDPCLAIYGHATIYTILPALRFQLESWYLSFTKHWSWLLWLFWATHTHFSCYISIYSVFVYQPARCFLLILARAQDFPYSFSILILVGASDSGYCNAHAQSLSQSPYYLVQNIDYCTCV